MILAEGSILIALIVVGGLSLIIFNFKYIKSKNSNQKFLLTLTHDIKTSLGALLLSIESNERNFSNEQISFKNQKKEILRLNTILENSLLKSKKENIKGKEEWISCARKPKRAERKYEQKKGVKWIEDGSNVVWLNNHQIGYLSS